jgi:hypothetical protein
MVGSCWGKVLYSLVVRPSPSTRPIGPARPGLSGSRISSIQARQHHQGLTCSPDLPYPTRIPTGTNDRVYLRSTRDLRDTTYDIRLDRAPEASPMSCRSYKIERLRLAVVEPGISVRPRPRLHQLPIPAYIGIISTAP